METLIRLGVAAVELLEAEGRALKRNVMRVAVAVGAGVVLLVVAVVGVGFLLSGCYLLLAQFLTPAESAGLIGLAALAVAGAGVWIVKRVIL